MELPKRRKPIKTSRENVSVKSDDPDISRRDILFCNAIVSTTEQIYVIYDMVTTSADVIDDCFNRLKLKRFNILEIRMNIKKKWVNQASI